MHARLKSQHRTGRYRRRRGTVLIVTLVMSFALAGAVLVLCRSMRVETIAASNLAAAAQAAAVERGAEQYVLGLLQQEGEAVRDLSENEFAEIRIGDGAFWILRPQYADSDDLAVFGLVEESGKININTEAGLYDRLVRLPGMTNTAASSVLDWIDGDSDLEVENGRDGAENQYYQTMPDPYYAKNGPFESVEELLMVRGWTRQMLYGDGTAPPMGQRTAMTVSSGGATVDPQIAMGLYDLLTIHSVEPNTNAEGQARIDLDDLDERRVRLALHARLLARLPKARADRLVVAFGERDLDDVFQAYQRGKTGAQMTAEEFDLIADDLTTTGNRTLRGRINVNTAPRAVLQSLRGIEQADVDKILAARSSNVPASGTSTRIAWIADAVGVEKAVAARLGGQITTRAFQWSADILAVSGNGRAFKRVRVVVDNRTGTPQIKYRRDITHRGWPMDRQVLASIRSGGLQQSQNMGGVASLGGGGN